MNVPEGMRVILQGKVDYMREIAQLLDAADIRTCSGPVPGGGWGTSAWLAVASRDIDRAMLVFKNHNDRMLAREGLPVRDVVCDFDADETECPACLTKFRTAGVSRCPECGLNFGG